MNWTVVLAIALLVAAAIRFSADPRRTERAVATARADAVAEVALTAQRAAELWVAANPGIDGAVPLAGTQGRSVTGVSSCASARRVATWVLESAGAPAGAVAAAMRARLGGWPGAGIASAGHVLAGAETRAVLPCAVPDGVPVVVTTVP